MFLACSKLQGTERQTECRCHPGRCKDQETSKLRTNSRRALGKNNRKILVVHHGTANGRPDRDFDNVPSRFPVIARRICKRRIPAQGETVVPATENGITRLQFEKAEPGAFLILRHGRSSSQLGSGNIADGIVVVGVANTSREMEGESRKDMCGSALIERLRLMLKPGEMTLQSRTQS